MESQKEVDELKKTLENNTSKPIKSPIKRFNYFIKDKEDNKLTFKEFMSKWKEGIMNLTPLQRITNEARGTLISLIGFIVALIAMIIYRDKFIVSWFAYGIILVFLGSIWTTGLRYLALRQQAKLLRKIESDSIGEALEEEQLDSDGVYIDFTETLKGGKNGLRRST